MNIRTFTAQYILDLESNVNCFDKCLPEALKVVVLLAYITNQRQTEYTALLLESKSTDTPC